MPLDFQKARDWLSQFDFHNLFIDELGWNQPSSQKVVESLSIEGITYERRRIAEMAGVPVLEITAANGEIPKADDRTRIHKEISEAVSIENLLLFVNGDRTRSLWYWAKREGSKAYPRTETYVRYQPADLLLSKIGGLKFGLEELGANGEVPVFEVADRLQKSLDVEQVTKKFYKEFELEHQEFLGYIRGIDKESDRRWYVSVILNRLMFVYFLQKKGFLDNGDTQYLSKKLQASQKQGVDRFFNEFLETLFFEGFAKPERDRSREVKALIGKVCYLNGGLFLKHQIEQTYPKIEIPDEGFQRVFALFEKYSWHLDDRPAGKPNEINPDVLGYIFEKYINQKAFGAYYTRPEITEYLCDRTINKLILDRVNATLPQQQDPRQIQQFDSIDDLVMHMEIDVCRHLVYGEDSILRNLSLLDPACGSGAFLIAAMKTLIRIYERVIGVVQLSTDHQLRGWLDEVVKNHPSLPYFIKKRIITDNLYGVDIMEEAVEIAKLRLFLALVSSARQADELEPLPNIDFNIMAGNSLIGLVRVDESGFDAIDSSGDVQMSLLGSIAVQSYQKILEEKNANIDLYKKHAFLSEDTGGTDQDDRLQTLRNEIDKINRDSEIKLNQLLLDEFSQKLGIKYEQAQLNGKIQKRLLTLKDIEDLKPFHWGYHFDRVMAGGGFDAIITNPPWEIFKPNGKEFFSEHSELITRKKMDLEDFEKEKNILLKDPDIANAWVKYQNQFPHINLYFRSTQQYINQISIIDGKKAKVDINLYKLFLEQCFNLLKSYGECGIVIPSSIYTDLGAKQLREMLLFKTQVTGLFCFENRKLIFEGVDSRFKFVILTFEKDRATEEFPATFMCRDLKDLERFPNKDTASISVALIRRLSPNSLSIAELKNEIEVEIAEKMLRFHLLGELVPNRWQIILYREFHMTDDRAMFNLERPLDGMALYEGKMIHQFDHQYSEPRYWVSESIARKAVLKSKSDEGQKLDYQEYRLGFRDIAASTNERTMISTIIPRTFHGNKIPATKIFNENGERLIDNSSQLFVCAVWNSFVIDWLLRRKITTTLNYFYIYQLPVPRLIEGDRYFDEIVERAAKLICTTPEFDDLAAEVGLGSHANGVTDAAERAQLRAELDGMIAHLYGLTEAEFTHILSTFPIVPEEVKQAALEEYRNLAPKVGDAEILNLIAQGESAQLEFKSTARWDLRENKKNPVLEEVILKTVAAFLNSDGGTLLIGVDDDGNILGLQNDYQAFTKKPNRDGYELWLTNDLLLKEMGKEFAPFIHISFHIIDNQEICKVAVERAPEPAYVMIRSKNGQPEQCLFIRTGNSTTKLDTPKAIANYAKTRWS